MDTRVKIQSKTYQLQRYPKTSDKSLRAWSNAELLVLDYITDKYIEGLHLFNDRFGVWNCALQHKKVTAVWTYASQQKAIRQNLKLNNISTEVDFKTPLDNLESVDLALIKIPKSLELFELFLQQIHKASHENTEVVCGFMTKYFSVSFIKVAEQYFEGVTQSKAWKKARLLILKVPKKEVKQKDLINTIQWKSKVLQQYYGVFSSGSIDIGTQFFLENLEVKTEELKVLDVASGNGIIAYEVTEQNPQAEVTLLDDFNLAIESSKINLEEKKAEFLCDDTLEGVKQNSFDLVVSNPPFHFEYENNIEVALNLFKGVENCLKNNGRFLLVANSHLNYSTHLTKLFTSVSVLQQNKKFQIIECIKKR
ncbi:16S rRNA m(2)G 1207 methyltransferase /23S rRNA m(2)G-1835 methyltransferase [Tenacibaculum mesophilum]|uniref:Methyltransferase domain-containing protein n=1 Tax=Tenacibaculum mesophilum TaxID=104268 RepID=A0ABN5T6K7_9FLAO|nr:methyltransferase [Tenacibaculum mesophilum]AZJ32090.1 methyltransferase domain-containing protein [Tenacibaculum mesophilum]QFS27349.1 methyltransferase [Tenacibaculum mesophilum]SHF89666.1 16S rRNA m(2)G 1207 methyltransferase /23S rRNA m(2)G-1835 methyltransferase [Tenacibaculum mesophilum]